MLRRHAYPRSAKHSSESQCASQSHVTAFRRSYRWCAWHALVGSGDVSESSMKPSSQVKVHAHTGVYPLLSASYMLSAELVLVVLSDHALSCYLGCSQLCAAAG